MRFESGRDFSARSRKRVLSCQYLRQVLRKFSYFMIIVFYFYIVFMIHLLLTVLAIIFLTSFVFSIFLSRLQNLSRKPSSSSSSRLFCLSFVAHGRIQFFRSQSLVPLPLILLQVTNIKHFPSCFRSTPIQDADSKTPRTMPPRVFSISSASSR